MGSNFRERAEKSESVGSDTVTVWGVISMKVQKKVKVGERHSDSVGSNFRERAEKVGGHCSPICSHLQAAALF